MVFDVEKDDFGDLITAGDWLCATAVGAFIPTDGCGYWGTATHYSYDCDCFGPAPEGATHVHWFNR